MKHLILFLFIFHFCSATSHTLKGRVLDEHGNPIPAAAVIHLNAGDSAFIQATITDSLGRYDFV